MKILSNGERYRIQLDNGEFYRHPASHFTWDSMEYEDALDMIKALSKQIQWKVVYDTEKEGAQTSLDGTVDPGIIANNKARCEQQAESENSYFQHELHNARLIEEAFQKRKENEGVGCDS